MTFQVRLSPCADPSDGARDFDRYEELGLPGAWIDRFRQSPGHWIAPDEYFWTPTPFFTALGSDVTGLIDEVRALTGGCFFDLPLTRQCDLIGARYICVLLKEMAGPNASTHGTGKSGVELQALSFLSLDGWAGDPCEGSAFHLAKHLVHSKIADQGLDFGPMNMVTYTQIDRAVLTAEESSALNAAVDSISDDALLVAYDEFRLWKGRVPADWRRLSRKEKLAGLRQKPFILLPQGSSTLTPDHVLEGWRALGPVGVKQVCERWMLGFGGMGWPDLTLHRQGELRLVEVKKKGDKFTHRQTYWIRNIASPLGWPVEVLHVV
jgi:hypothetical protein